MSGYKNTTVQRIEIFPGEFQVLSYEVFVFSTARAGKKLLRPSAMNKSLQSLLRNESHYYHLSHRLKPYKFFLQVQKYSEQASKSISSLMSVSPSFVKKKKKEENVMELQYSQLNVLEDKEA